MLSITNNKVQLIDLIVADMKANPVKEHNRLIVTTSGPTPFECLEVYNRPDVLNTQEEADTILVCQLNSQQNDKTAVVVADDTDVFCILLHCVHVKRIMCKVIFY